MKTFVVLFALLAAGCSDVSRSDASVGDAGCVADASMIADTTSIADRHPSVIVVRVGHWRDEHTCLLDWSTDQTRVRCNIYTLWNASDGGRPRAWLISEAPPEYPSAQPYPTGSCACATDYDELGLMMFGIDGDSPRIPHQLIRSGDTCAFGILDTAEVDPTYTYRMHMDRLARLYPAPPRDR